MKVAAMQVERKAMLENARALQAEVGDEPMTDEQRTMAEDLKTRIERVDADIKRCEYFDTLTARAIEDTATAPSPADEWSLNCRKFSIRTAAVMAAGTAGSLDTGLEQEVSDELAKRTGRSYEGVAAPMECLSVRADWLGLETRDVSTTTPAGGPGSRIVPQDYRPGDYIDLLRDSLVTRQLGIRVLRGLNGDVRIPKAGTGVAAGWAAENGAIATGDMSFAEQVTLSPHKVGVITAFSGQLLRQSSPDIEQLTRADLAAALATAIDEVVVEGGGAQEPDGVIATIARTARRTSDPANGVALAASEIFALMQAVDEANIGQGMRAFLFANGLRYHASQQVRFANTDRTWWQNGQLLDTKSIVSEIAPTATRGSLADAPTLIYGNWSDILLGYFGDLDVMANPYGTGFASGDVQVRVLAYADVAFRHEEAFGYLDGLIL